MNHFLKILVLGTAMLLCTCGGSGKSLFPSSTQATVTAQTPAWTPADASLAEFKAYTFTTQGGSDLAGDTIVEYEWDFGDGTPPLTHAGASVTHAFITAGPFQVSVRALDARLQASAPAQAQVTVVAGPDPFTLTPLTPAQPTTLKTHAGNPVPFQYSLFAADLATSLAPGDLVLAPGAPNALLGNPSANGNTFALPVTYLAPASGSQVCNATVQIQDSLGNRSPLAAFPPVTLTLVTTDTPPVVTLKARSVDNQPPGDAFPGVAVTFTASATDAEFDPLVCAWSFGDGGQGDLTGLTGPAALTQAHTYQTPGAYTVTFTADDGWPGGKATATVAVEILPAGTPVASVTYAPAAPVYAHVPMIFTSQASDTAGYALDYAWWVDGQEAGSNPVLAYTFANPGPQNVQLTVTDPTGAQGTWTATLDVLPDQPPTATLANDPTVPLKEYVPITFTATGMTPEAGNAISSYNWNVAGTTFSTPGPTLTQAFYDAGTVTVQVQAVDNHGAVGAYSAPAVFTVLPETRPGLSSLTDLPSAASVPLGGAWTGTAVLQVTGTQMAGSPPFLPLQSATVDPGDPTATGTVTATPGGLLTVQLTYPAAAAPGLRVLTPTLQVVDANGIPSGPQNLTTLSVTTQAPLGPLTLAYVGDTPPVVTSNLVTTQYLETQVVDPMANFTTVNASWGDGTTATTSCYGYAAALGQTAYWDHTYTQPGTYQATFSASDGLSTVQLPPLTFIIQPDAYPTATILTPTASSVLPAPGTFPAGGPVIPPGPQDPQVLVVPLNATVLFTGVATGPTAGSYTTAWSAPGARLAGPAPTATQAQWVFPGVPGQLTPYLVTFVAVDQLGRTSSDPASGNKPNAFSKWVVVDGLHSERLNVTFCYRQVSDQTGQATLAPATLAANGLGRTVTLYQDGVSQPYQIQNAAGTQATLALPMRGDLPAYLDLPPAFNGDKDFTLFIPNAPSGPGDPMLAPPTGSASSLTFANPAFPWNPALQLALAQGFAAETTPTDLGVIQGALTALPPAGANTWVLNRIADNPANVPGPLTQTLNPLSPLSFQANQTSAEWVLTTLLPSAAAGAMPFLVNYAQASSPFAQSSAFGTTGLGAFRIPGGGADPYDAGSTVNGWNAPSTVATLTPTPIAGGFPTLVGQDLFTNASAGGLQNFQVPYDPNDPDRALLAPQPRPFTAAPATLGYAEYLWSPVWARPLVLSNASLADADAAQGALGSYASFFSSAAPAWPKLLGASAIVPDRSTFDLTPTGFGAFLASSPVAVQGAQATPGGVGRLYWTAYTPSYSPDGPSLIARTWASDPATGQPYAVPQPPGPGLPQAALGLIPPQDVKLDLRGRAPGTGQVTGPTGGFRVLWYNPMLDNQGNVAPPDFWVVNVGSQYFVLPAGAPVSPGLAASLVTDLPVYLPSGNTPAQGPATNPATQAITDQAAPGYCWFDVPAPFAPAPNPGSTTTIAVFGLRSIPASGPGARPLTLPDWVDAFRLATAVGNAVLPSGLGTLDLFPAFRVPLQFPWNIAMASSAVLQVAP